MPKITSFRELLVWQKSMNLAERCYRVSKRFPRDDQPVLGYVGRMLHGLVNSLAR